MFSEVQDKFEAYWEANLKFRLRGVLGLDTTKLDSLKQMFFDTWKASHYESKVPVEFNGTASNYDIETGKQF